MMLSQVGAVTVLCQVFHGSTAQAALLWPFLSAVLAAVLMLLLALATGAGARRSSPLHRRLPPSPPSLPVTGHLHLVGPNPHVSLRDLAVKYAGAADGLLLLRLGQVPNLVASSPRAARAVLRTQDHVFASRPRSAASDVLLHGPSDVAMAPYGEYWRQARKLVAVHLLSAGKVRSLRAAREEEVRLALAKVRDAAAARATVDVSEMLSAFANDVACRTVSGRLYPAGVRSRNRNRVFRELLDGSSALLGSFHLDNYFPSLTKVDLLARVMCAGAKRLRKRWDELLDEIIQEHAETAKPEDDDDGDFVDVLLSLQQEYGLTTDQTKGILQDMLAAGTDTSYIVLEYCMVELIRNPCLLAKLQRAVTKNTPKGQKMAEEDNISNMPYLKAVIKESLRLHPPSPLLLPHLSMAECEVNGYTIPAGTRVIVNAWAIARDAGSWDKAEEFIPERFMDGGSGGNRVVDFQEDFMFLPFGAGRRVCPGVNLGMATVEIMLANLVCCFDWELPTGMTSEDVDMTDVFGSLMRRRDRLLLVPRIREANLLS